MMAVAPTSAPMPKQNALPQNAGYGSVLQNLIASIQAPNMPSNIASDPVSAFVNMTNQANQANATRGQDILSLLQGQGQAQLAANRQGYQQQLGGINQDMMSKGLANTSVGNNLQQGAINQLNQANEGVNEHTAMNVANMANSFTQAAPPISLLSQLLQNGGASTPHTTTTTIGAIPSDPYMSGNTGSYSGPGSPVPGFNYGGQVYNPSAGQNPFAMQAPAATQVPTGGGSLSLNGQQVYSGDSTGSGGMDSWLGLLSGMLNTNGTSGGGAAPDMSIPGDSLFQ